LDTHDPAAREAALRRVSAPAIALALAAGIGAAFSLIGLAINLLGLGVTPLIDAHGDERVAWFVSGAWNVVWAIYGMGMSGFLIWASLKMRAMESYALALTACVVSMIPCVGPCCILGLPFGIWGLVVIHDRDVRPHFTR